MTTDPRVTEILFLVLLCIPGLLWLAHLIYRFLQPPRARPGLFVHPAAVAVLGVLLLGFAIPLQIIMPLVKEYAPIILQALLAYLALHGAKWVKANVKDKQLQDALLQAEKAVSDAVMLVQQTYVDALVERSKDGKLTKQEQQEALRAAIAAVLELLPPSVVIVLRAAFGAKLEAWVGNKIEAQLGRGKVSKRILDGSRSRALKMIDEAPSQKAGPA